MYHMERLTDDGEFGAGVRVYGGDGEPAADLRGPTAETIYATWQNLHATEDARAAIAFAHGVVLTLNHVAITGALPVVDGGG